MQNTHKDNPPHGGESPPLFPAMGRQMTLGGVLYPGLGDRGLSLFIEDPRVFLVHPLEVKRLSLSQEGRDQLSSLETISTDKGLVYICPRRRSLRTTDPSTNTGPKRPCKLDLSGLSQEVQVEDTQASGAQAPPARSPQSSGSSTPDSRMAGPQGLSLPPPLRRSFTF